LVHPFLLLSHNIKPLSRYPLQQKFHTSKDALMLSMPLNNPLQQIFQRTLQSKLYLFIFVLYSKHLGYRKLFCYFGRLIFTSILEILKGFYQCQIHGNSKIQRSFKLKSLFHQLCSLIRRNNP